MSRGVARYIAELDALYAARQRAGGALSVAEEYAWTRVFEPLWDVLTPAERAAVIEAVEERKRR